MRLRPLSPARAWPVGAGERLLELAGPFPTGDPLLAELERRLEAAGRPGDPAKLAQLVGLGPGSTPAGDDLLLGLLAGLEWAAPLRPGARALHRALAAALPRPLEEHTGELSARLLNGASRGLHVEPVRAVLAALAEPVRLAEAARGLAGQGALSGGMALRGIGLALDWAISPRYVPYPHVQAE